MMPSLKCWEEGEWDEGTKWKQIGTKTRKGSRQQQRDIERYSSRVLVMQGIFDGKKTRPRNVITRKSEEIDASIDGEKLQNVEGAVN